MCYVLYPQALSEERASAIEKLQLQLELANEKVAVLTAELAHLEQEGRQVGRERRGLEHMPLNYLHLQHLDGIWNPAAFWRRVNSDVATACAVPAVRLCPQRLDLAMQLPCAAHNTDSSPCTAASRSPPVRAVLMQRCLCVSLCRVCSSYNSSMLMQPAS